MRTGLVILLALLLSGCLHRKATNKAPLFELRDCLVTAKSADGKTEACDCFHTREIGIDARNGAKVYECNSSEVKK